MTGCQESRSGDTAGPGAAAGHGPAAPSLYILIIKLSF